MTSILFVIVKIYAIPEVFFHFWNLNQICNILKKRWASYLMFLKNFGLRQTFLDKFLKSPVSEHRSTVNMLNGRKHFWNLPHRSFIRFSHHADTNGVGKYFSYWYMKSSDCFLTHWLTMTSISFLIVRIYRNQFKCIYIRTKKTISQFFAPFL